MGAEEPGTEGDRGQPKRRSKSRGANTGDDDRDGKTGRQSRKTFRKGGRGTGDDDGSLPGRKGGRGKGRDRDGGRGGAAAQAAAADQGKIGERKWVHDGAWCGGAGLGATVSASARWQTRGTELMATVGLAAIRWVGAAGGFADRFIPGCPAAADIRKRRGARAERKQARKERDEANAREKVGSLTHARLLSPPHHPSSLPHTTPPLPPLLPRTRPLPPLSQEEILGVGAAGISVDELAERLAVTPAEVIKALFLKGIMAQMNQQLDADAVKVVADQYGVLVVDEEDDDVSKAAKVRGGRGDRETTTCPRQSVSHAVPESPLLSPSRASSVTKTLPSLLGKESTRSPVHLPHSHLL